ncbi:rab GTPase-binding effector protein 2 [Synchiropus splendidus]|uniref:rab GTPase-binding effector protein 2 n=1 Tax=Synchiropus splendidus TaxID=270530 RepID=UPI00237D401A|nr:rab GTPase-binding effector protein 2 [Synchiropus splendidus]
MSSDRETAEQCEAPDSSKVKTLHTAGVPGSGMDLEPAAPDSQATALAADGFFSLSHSDSASLSSFSLDTPSLPRKNHAQDDTDSLVSTGTLVPEAIYLPPAGHRLVPYSDWDSLHMQVSDLREEAGRLLAEKQELEKELDVQADRTRTQVSMLQAQVHNSESLLQDLHKSLAQSQKAVQIRLAELSVSQKKLCTELCRLKGEEVEQEEGESGASLAEQLQVAHSEERLRIEIVTLQEQLDVRAEENEVLEVQFSSLRTETERIQAQRDKLQSDLLSCRTELEGLRVALSHIQNHNRTLASDKAALQQQSLELRSQVISLRSQVDTSQTVQRDFVQLSQSLQVKLELVRQAETLEQIREILEAVDQRATPPAGDPLPQ